MSIYEYNEEEHMRMEREDAYADGQASGCLKGQNRILDLIRKMTNDGMSENIARIPTEPDLLEEMLEKYGLN